MKNIEKIAQVIINDTGVDSFTMSEIQSEGKDILLDFVKMMMSEGIYTAMSNLTNFEISKIIKYNRDIGAKLSKAKTYFAKDVTNLVSDLNIWFKEQM
jgi:hypothetical protein